jgi:hypothetical protein
MDNRHVATARDFYVLANATTAMFTQVPLPPKSSSTYSLQIGVDLLQQTLEHMQKKALDRHNNRSCM